MADLHHGRWRAWGRRLVRLMGPALLLIMLWRSDLALVARTLARAEPLPIGLALALALPFAVCKGWRWQLALRMLGARLPLAVATRLWCAGFLWGALTPGQSGDLARAWCLRRSGLPLRLGLFSLALERCSDLALTLAVALLGGLLVWSPTALQAIWLPAGLVLAASLLLWRLPWLWQRLIAPRRSDGLPIALDLRLAPALGLVSALALSWTYLRIGLVCAALDLALAPGLLIAMTAWLALLGPLAPAGLGTRDALLIVALRAAAVPEALLLEQALALSALILLLNLEQMALGALCALRLPMPAAATPASAEAVVPAP
ncbi:lysylphosphatidylglycerol synthase domain-containing protein [Kallotenue papyrolyticum]|uniref:lysylphosphatidylglycerol synthase domain-containing protein n=1 Tax=Kallotenue papyrolyticum TaxID=1325125 RepID=UPI0004785C0B|nr:lysylphosphatidylglycerol synthase domain-containing protein [Kallotenue papyrolyticum]